MPRPTPAFGLCAAGIDLLGDDAKMLKRMLPKNHGNRNVASITASSDQNAANATAIVSRIESMPVRTEVNFEPGAEIHRIGVERNTNVTEIACGVARRDIHAAAESNRKMGKVATDAHALAKCVKSRSIGTGLQVVEAEVAVDKIANGLYTRPAGRRVAERSPGKIKQFAVDFAVPARQHECERLDRNLSNIMLDRVRCVGVQFPRITNDCVVEKTNDASGGIDAPAMVTETVNVFLDRQFRLQSKFLGADEVAFA